MRDQAEYRLQCLVADLLRLQAKPGVFWFHPANGENRSARTGARLKRMGVIPGVPDLVLCIDGQFYGLELKAEKGRATQTQRAAEEAIDAAGGVYHCAHGYAAAVAFLESVGAIRSVREVERFRPREAVA